MTAPPKPPAKPQPAARPAATWTVFELLTGVDVYTAEDAPNAILAAVRGGEDAGQEPEPRASNAVVLVEIDGNVVSRTAADACWRIAETTLKDRATSAEPPVLTASRNGTQYGLNEARPYALKQTVERIK